eukprot:45935_1
MIQDESTPQKHIMDQYKSFPLLWNPEQNLTPQQLQQLIHANNVQNIKIRFHRAFYILAMPVAFLVFITTFPDHSFAQVAGCGILLMFMLYFGNIFMFLYSGAAVFRIYSPSALPSGWIDMSITSHQLLYKNKAIESISELSAISGGEARVMLATLSAYSWTIVCMLLAAYSTFDCDFTWDIVDYLQLIGAAGLILVGIFELDPYNLWMRRMHYFGALSGVSGTVFGYAIQQYSIGTKMWLPILIGSVCVIAGCWWQYCCNCADKFEQKYENISPEDVGEIKDEITRWSIKCVTAEAIFLFCGVLSISLWLME